MVATSGENIGGGSMTLPLGSGREKGLSAGAEGGCQLSPGEEKTLGKRQTERSKVFVFSIWYRQDKKGKKKTALWSLYK
jgi:hypothetical protein